MPKASLKKADIVMFLCLAIVVVVFVFAAGRCSREADAQTALPVSLDTGVIYWTAPTQNADGTPLTDLAKYRWLVAPAGVDLRVEGNIPLSDWTTPDASCPGDPCEVPIRTLMEGLPNGTYQVWGHAIDTSGNESLISAPSNVFDFDGIAPRPQTNVRVGRRQVASFYQRIEHPEGDMIVQTVVWREDQAGG